MKIIPFSLSAELDSEPIIQEYLRQVQADGDAEELQRALLHVAQARAGLQQAPKTVQTSG